METYTNIPEEVLEMERTGGTLQADVNTNTGIIGPLDATTLCLISAVMLVAVVAIAILKTVNRKGHRAKSMSMLKQEAVRNEQKVRNRERRRIEENKVKRPSGVPVSLDADDDPKPRRAKKQTSRKKNKNEDIANIFNDAILDDTVSVEVDDSLFGDYSGDLCGESDISLDFFDDSLDAKSNSVTNKEDEVDDLFASGLLEPCEPKESVEPKNPHVPLSVPEDSNFEQTMNATQEAQVVCAPVEEPKVVTSVEKPKVVTPVEEPKVVAPVEEPEHVISYVGSYQEEEVPIPVEDIIGNPVQALECLKSCKGVTSIINKVRVNDKEEDLPVDVQKGSKITATFRTKFDFDFQAAITLDKLNCEQLEIKPELVFNEKDKKKMIMITFNAPCDLRMENIHVKIENDMSAIASGKVNLVVHLVLDV